MVLVKMGNLLTYRPTPQRKFDSQEGWNTYYNFGSNQITGWRNNQEDRYICLPNFHKDLSMFAVYDGHGGEDVAQYLQNYLHLNILHELQQNENDIELALFLGFLTCENSLLNITDEELAVIKNDTIKEFRIPDHAERRSVISKFAGIFSSSAAGTSTEGSSQNQEGLREAIASEAVKFVNENPASIKFLLQAPLAAEDDEADDDYNPEMDVNNPDEPEDGNNELMEESAEEEEDEMIQDEKDEDEEDSDYQEASSMPVEDDENQSENCDQNDDIVTTDGEVCKSNQENTASCASVAVNLPKNESKPKVGFACGSTATVLITQPNKIYVANVGDSRCVACINGEAVPLTVDHKPEDEEEMKRIVEAQSYVENGRTEGTLDMSRAFGDFKFKMKPVEDHEQAIICHPHITSVSTKDLEFLIVASDGIWNAMSNEEVVSFINNRLKTMEIRDICGELFEVILPDDITPDGTGCDNMTAIIIVFHLNDQLSMGTSVKEVYEYSYHLQKSTTQSGNKNVNNVADQTKAKQTQLKTTKLRSNEAQLPKSEVEIIDMREPFPSTSTILGNFGSVNTSVNIDDIIEPIPQPQPFNCINMSPYTQDQETPLQIMERCFLRMNTLLTRIDMIRHEFMSIKSDLQSQILNFHKSRYENARVPARQNVASAENGATAFGTGRIISMQSIPRTENHSNDSHARNGSIEMIDLCIDDADMPSDNNISSEAADNDNNCTELGDGKIPADGGSNSEDTEDNNS